MIGAGLLAVSLVAGDVPARRVFRIEAADSCRLE
jgi:hypothetical protein